MDKPYVASGRPQNCSIASLTPDFFLTMEQLRLEALYFGLRTKKGISLLDFKNQYHYDLFTEKKEMLSVLEEEGFISIQDGTLYPTQTGLAVADSLALIEAL